MSNSDSICDKTITILPFLALEGNELKLGILCALTAYLTASALLRFRRMRTLHKQFGFPTRESLAEMTDFDAFKIQQVLNGLEFPFMFRLSVGFSLFKVRPNLVHPDEPVTQKLTCW